MLPFKELSEKQFANTNSAAPSFEEIKGFADYAGWANSIDQNYYQKHIEKNANTNRLVFRSAQDEFICDTFAVWMLIKNSKMLNMPYSSLLSTNAHNLCMQHWL